MKVDLRPLCLALLPLGLGACAGHPFPTEPIGLPNRGMDIPLEDAHEFGHEYIIDWVQDVDATEVVRIMPIDRLPRLAAVQAAGAAPSGGSQS